jgi:hypothetical protein
MDPKFLHQKRVVFSTMRARILARMLFLCVLAAFCPRTVQADSDSKTSPPPAEDPSQYAVGEEENAGGSAVDPPAVNPAVEGFKAGVYEGHGEFELGYRWSSGIGGNQQMYRSQVNLFEGVRLLRSFVSLRSDYGSQGLFDRLDFSLNNWGDPYNTMRLDISRGDLYRFTASYRNLNYCNFISSFANPLLSQEELFAQHNLNTDYRMTDLELRLFPNHKISPYVGYYRNSGTGPGFTTYYPTGNEFLLNTRWEYTGDDYRGGVQLSFPNWNLVLEQGYRHLKNDMGLTDAGERNGNSTIPFMGQPVVLDSLDRSYHERISLPTSKIVAKANPSDDLILTARYIYTMGELDTDLFETQSGSLVSLEDLLRYGSALDSFSGKAKRPNHNGAFSVEYAPTSRLTVTDRVDTFDYNVSGSAMLSSLFANATSLLGPGPTFDTNVSEVLNSRLDYSEVRNEAELEYSLGRGLSVRAGHRYTFIDATIEDSRRNAEKASLSRNTALVGFDYRPGQKLRVGFGYENNRANNPLVRTTLLDYDRFNVDWRFGPWKGFTLNGRVSVLRNSDPANDIDWTSHDRDYTIALNYQPSERISLDLDYSRSNLFSDIAVVIPQTLASARSIFDERTSGIGARMEVEIFRRNRIEIGYRGMINRGSFPLDYHQPYAALWIPLQRHLAFRPFWQFYGYSEKITPSEDYRTHLVIFSLVYSR